MAITLPLPVRVAAGLLATGIDLVRSLPDDIPAIPVSLVGKAMRLSMKVQQEIAALATRGDELLGGVIAAPQENPAWAKFDDDEPVTPAPKPRPKSAPGPAAPKPAAPKPVAAKPAEQTPAEQTPAVNTTGTKGPAAPPPDPVTPTPADNADAEPAGTEPSGSAPAGTEAGGAEAGGAEAGGTEADGTEPGGAEGGDNNAPSGAEPTSLTTPAESAIAPVTTTAMEAAVDVPAATIEQAMLAAGDAKADSVTVPTRPMDETSGGSDPDRAATDDAEPADAAHDHRAENGPAALPGYDSMTLAQVRGHLRELSAADVAELLQYEQVGDNRAPFLTLLSNRLVTLDAQNP